jgi:predicted alternative tryptophan synthase beta-subunit
MREAWRKQRGGSDDGVAEILARMLPRALGERELSRRRWVMRPREVFERWAGVDVPLH